MSIAKFNQGQAAKILNGQITQNGAALDNKLATDEQDFVQRQLSGLKSNNPTLYASAINTLNKAINGNGGAVAKIGRWIGNHVSSADARVSRAASMAQAQLGGPINYANEHDRVVFAQDLIQWNASNESI
ncbi:MAG TPA: hypothetical protein VF269_06660 [Rhodanobacteraceae bacterium]